MLIEFHTIMYPKPSLTI